MRRVVFHVLICFFVLSGVSMARDRGDPKDGIDLPHGKWWKMAGVANELNISSDEQAKLDDLYYKHRNQMIDLKRDLKKAQLVLEWFIEKEKFDESTSMDQFQKVLNARNEISTERYNFLIEVRKLLGLERFQQLKAKFQKLRMERSRREGPMDKGGRP